MSDLMIGNLQLSYGSGKQAQAILNGVTLDLQPGEILALLGPSGSGKTTLLRAIAGLESPNGGMIAIGGKTLFDADNSIDIPAEQRHLGLVFQSYALWPHKTVFENVAYGLRLRRTGQGEINQRVEQVLMQLGLANLQQRYPHQLSGGQQQRVAIARALVYKPPVLLLDEPLSNLDAKLREESRNFLRSLIKQLRLSAVIVTHDQQEAMAIADRIVLLNHGLIEQIGSPQDIYQTPATLFSAEFMGSNNCFAVKLQRDTAESGWIEVAGQLLQGSLRQAPNHAGMTALVRVEQVSIHSEPVTNSLSVMLDSCVYLGERWECRFSVRPVSEQNDGLPLPAKASLRAYSNSELANGQYWLQMDPAALWVF